MRPLSILLLTVLLVTALSPVAVLTFPVAEDCSTAFGTLDVCHQANPAVSVSGLMPFIGEHLGAQAPSIDITYADRITPIILQFLLATRTDRPPQA